MLIHTTHLTLLERLGDDGDSAAWDEFCSRYGDLIRAFARGRGLQGSDCDDVLQDVLVSLNRAMPGFEYDPTRGKFRSYLKTVTVHAIFRRMRQNGTASALPHGDAPEEDPQMDQAWEAEWRQYHLRAALRTIEAEFSEAHRTAFRLYAVEGLGAQQTAAALDLSVDQVYQIKSRMLRRLGEQIALQVEEEG